MNFASVTLPRLLKLFLGVAFIWAGASKLQHPLSFADTIATFELLPPALVSPLAIGLPPYEILLGTLLSANIRARTASLGIILLMVSFALALAQAALRGISVDCHCFGANWATPVGIALFRDFLILAAAVFVFRNELKAMPARASAE